jgi:hypothetical protein
MFFLRGGFYYKVFDENNMPKHKQNPPSKGDGEGAQDIQNVNVQGEANCSLRMCIKVGMKLNAKLSHKNVSRGIELVKLLKIHYKIMFNKKLLSLELLKVMIDNHKS